MRLLREINRALSSVPFMLAVFGYVSYHFVVDDGLPWWLPPLVFAGAVGAGFLEGRRQARRRQRSP